MSKSKRVTTAPNRLAHDADLGAGWRVRFQMISLTWPRPVARWRLALLVATLLLVISREALSDTQFESDVDACKAAISVGEGSEHHIRQVAPVQFNSWLQAAPSDPDAAWLVGRCYALGVSVPKDVQQAANYFRDAAEGSSALGMSAFGKILLYGTGIDQDVEAGLKWLDKSASLNTTSAMIALGDWWARSAPEKDLERARAFYLRGAETGSVYARFLFANSFALGESPDYPRALNELQKLADLGFARAQSEVGYYFANGYGVEKDECEALRWYKLAAAQGFVLAQSNLGESYLFGRCVKEDWRESITWFRMAADQGNAIAQCFLGVILELHTEELKSDPQEIVRLYTEAANQGHADAEFQLGRLHYHGMYGVEQSETKALAYLQEAEKLGNVYCLTLLGVMHLYGEGGLQPSPREALRYFEESAKHSDKYAVHSVAVLRYQRIEGIEHNPEQSYRILTELVGQDFPTAYVDLGYLHLVGLGTEQSDEKARQFYKKAAEADVPAGHWFYAQALARGIGGEVDLDGFRFHLYQAAQKGFQPAIDLMINNTIDQVLQNRSTSGVGSDDWWFNNFDAISRSPGGTDLIEMHYNPDRYLGSDYSTPSGDAAY